MDDGSGVMLPYMIEIRHSIRENAMMGFELTEQLVAFGRQFHGQLQAALPSDIYAPEAIQLMTAWRELESKFIAFMDLVPFSDPLQLQAMLAQLPSYPRPGRYPHGGGGHHHRARSQAGHGHPRGRCDC